jgi:tryptophan synthase alpha chain
MNRIDAAFADLRRRGAKAFIPYLTAGLPDPAAQAATLADLQRAGATLVELGIPYSDPIADGPVIQASFNDALRKGVSRRQVLDIVRAARAAGVTLPLVAMVSYAIIHRTGAERYVREAAEAGFDGMIVPDLPVEEAEALAVVCAAHNFRLTLLVAPTTPPERRKRIAELSSGFLYCLSITGITGERTALPAELSANVAALKAATDKPVCVGFGISRPEHVAAAVAAGADGVIVGSALVKVQSDREALVAKVRELAAALPTTR